MVKTTHGATITLGATQLTGVTNIKLPNMTRGMIPASDHDTTTAKATIPEDLYELGDCVITMDYTAGSATDDACIAAMTAAAGSPVAVTGVVKAASGTEDIDFNAYGQDYDLLELPAASTDKQQAVLVLRPTGVKTQAASA